MARRRKRNEPTEPQQITRKEYLRQRKDLRERQALLAVIVPVLAAVLLFLGFGIYREVIREPREPVARVNDENITTGEFQKRIAYDRWLMLNNMATLMQFAQSDQPGFMNQLFDQQRANLPDSSVSNLIDNVLVRQEANERGITVTDDDVEERIGNDMATQVAPDPTPVSLDEGEDAGEEAVEGEEGEAVGAAEAVTDTETMTDTEAAATLSSDEVEDAFTTYLQPVLDTTGLSRGDYRDIIRDILYREKLTESLGEELATTDKQVDVDHLVFQSEETAQAAVDALAGGADWEAVVAEYLQAEGEEGEADVAEEADAAGDEADEADADADAEDDAVDASDEASELGETSAITTTGSLTSTESLTATDGLTTTGALTTTGDITATEGITTTAPVTPTAVPAPTATPVPFAFERGERRWMTLAGLKTRLGLSDGDATDVLAATSGTAVGPFSGQKGFYVIIVLDVDEAREIDETELEELRAGALEPWLTTRRTEAKIDRFPLDGKVPPEPLWFSSQYESYVGAPQPTIDLSSLDLPAQPGADSGGDEGSSQDSGTAP